MRFLIPLLLLCVSLPSAARQFDVEVVIFKRVVDAESTTEAWPNTLPQIDMTNVGEFANTQYRSAKGVQMLSPSSYRLTPQVQALDNHAGFQVLFHKAWRQGDAGERAAPVFHIRAGKDYSEQFNPDGSEKSTTLGENGIGEVDVDPALYELDGKFQVYVQHYLYADIMLDLKKPSVRDVIIEPTELAEETLLQESEDGNVQIANMAEIAPTVEVEEFLKSYRFDQKRRMRSGETHYFDNPLMGVILQVRRVE